MQPLAWHERVLKGWEDYLFWQKQDKRMERINKLIREAQREPFSGVVSQSR